MRSTETPAVHGSTVSAAGSSRRSNASPAKARTSLARCLTPDDYSMDNTAGGGSYCGNDIASIRGLKAGGKRSGQVVFDVPSAKGEIIFKSPLGAVAGSWKVG